MQKRTNRSLHKGREGRNDEFYTRMEYLPAGLAPYREHLKHKKIYCCCDNPEKSSFVRYFAEHFQELELAGLTATCYCAEPQICRQMTLFGEEEIFSAVKSEGNGKYWNLAPEQAYGTFEEMIQRNPVSLLNGNGDFRSEECISIMQEHDIIITNPPFSLFREYVAQLMEYKKKFLIIGNMNAITYKEIFPLIKENKLWFGYGFNCSMVFKTQYQNTLEANRKYVISKGYNPDENYIKTPAVCWFTNLETSKRNEFLNTGKKYYGYENMYPKYDNYNAINVDKVSDIPMDYDGVMGVPITFMDKYNPEQFEIIDGLNRYTILDVVKINDWAKANHIHLTEINGKSKYLRILIKRKS